MFEERPMYPGNIYGPYPTKHLAQQDADAAPHKSVKVGNRTTRSRILFYGPGSRRIQLPTGPGSTKALAYYQDHPDEIPERCQHLFKTKARSDDTNR